MNMIPKRSPITLTINGVDGFLTGKWTLHANAVAVDDETLVLNATGAFQYSTLDVSVLPNSTYTIKREGEGTIKILSVDASNGTSSIFSDTTNLTVTFTTLSSSAKIRIYYASLGAGQFTFKRPMLNLGSVPAP